FKNEASYVLRLDDMIEGLRKESFRRNKEMDKMKVELSEAGRMKRHVEELDCKYELLDYKNEMLARYKEYLESTLARENTTMMDWLGWSDAEERSTNVIDVLTIYGSTPPRVKEYQEKDKIGSKLDKNGKRGEAGKSLKQLQLKEEEKPKKTKKEWPKTHTRIKSY
nr:hypothetical protein [Tanacetum cinerariifolium]